MCYQRHSFVLTENSNHPEHTGNDVRSHPKYVFQKNRRSTDEYWIGLFIVILIIWIISWHHLTWPIVFKTDYKNNITSNTTAFKLMKVIENVVGFSFLSHVIRFIDVLSKSKSGVFLISMHICITLITLPLLAIRLNDEFCKRMNMLCYLCITIIPEYFCHLMITVNMSGITGYGFGDEIAFWLLLETMCTLISARIMLPTIMYNYDEDIDPKKTCHEFMKYVSGMQVILIGILRTLKYVTVYSVRNLDCNNPLLYAIAGGSCYIGLTLYHYGLMVIACVTSMYLHCQELPFFLGFRASYIIGRYHFGTACYHTTLVFPRVQAAFVVNEAEFRKMPNFSAAERLYVTYSKIHNLSAPATAAIGLSYSESIRELLRDRDSMVKPFQNFTRKGAECVLYIVGFVNLALALLLLAFRWAGGAIIGLHLSARSWLMIVIVPFEVYMCTRTADAIWDTFWLHYDKDEDLDEEEYDQYAF